MNIFASIIFRIKSQTPTLTTIFCSRHSISSTAKQKKKEKKKRKKEEKKEKKKKKKKKKKRSWTNVRTITQPHLVPTNQHHYSKTIKIFLSKKMAKPSALWLGKTFFFAFSKIFGGGLFALARRCCAVWRQRVRFVAVPAIE